MGKFGRISKTTYLAEILSDADQLRYIGRQINKGEAVHSLKRFLLFANEGKIQKRHDDDMANQASCLSLVANIVMAWNAVYMWEAVTKLREEGFEVRDDDIGQLWPTRYKHINPYGKMDFDVEGIHKMRNKLRPLRNTN
jgi:TnpA family transposase